MKPIKPKVEKDEYELDDEPYLLITAIQELTKAIRDLTARALK